MIINHDRKFIFIHVPKTGGCSIRAVLSGETSKRGFHRSYRTIKKQYPDYFSFGFVRNPWDRMVSLYEFCLRKPKANPSYILDGFKKSLIRGFDLGQRDAMFYLDGCSYIGRMETMQKDFDHICKTIGCGGTLPVKNRTEHRCYKEYYDNESIEIIRNTHSETIERFGYEF